VTNDRDEHQTASERAPLPFREFIALLAWLMALTALSIDIMLPALPEIGRDLGASSDNERQLVVTTYLLGLALGQLVWGPISDRIGRKPPLLAGLVVYAVGGLVAYFSESLLVLLGARMLQGFGGAAARTIGTAIVRDAYEGRPMARVMSFVMTVFILVPVLAPAVGQGIIAVSTWRVSFLGLFFAGLVALAWVGLRLPETHPDRAAGQPANSKPRMGFGAGLRMIMTNRVTVGYGMASGFMFGTLVSYISSAQQIFVDHFGLGKLFPVAFGAIAGTMALAAMTNAQLVQRLGMRRLAHTGVICFIVVAGALVALAANGKPPMIPFAIMLGGCFFLFGITMPNLNAIAMQPVGQVAGLASSLIGSSTTVMGVIFGSIIGQSFDGTPRPLAIGFAAMGICAFLAVIAVEGRKGLFKGE